MRLIFPWLTFKPRTRQILSVVVALSLVRSPFPIVNSGSLPLKSSPTLFEEQSLAETPPAFTSPRLTRGFYSGLGGLTRTAGIPVYWLFKGQRPAPLLYRAAHLFPEHVIGRRTAVRIGLFAAVGESLGLQWIIRHAERTSIPVAMTVLCIALAGAALHGVLRLLDRDPPRRRLPVHYVAAQFAGLALYGSLVLAPIPVVIPILTNLYIQLKHFVPKWHPATAKEARLYAAHLEKTKDGRDIDFIKNIFVPQSIPQWWAYIHLLNVPVELLLNDLETFDRDSHEYKLTRIALTLNHRLMDYPLLQQKYHRWIEMGWHKKSEDLVASMLHLQYTGLLQKQEPAGKVRSRMTNRRTYRGRYPEVWEILLHSLAGFRRQGETGRLQVQSIGISDGSSVLDDIDYIKGKVHGVTIEAIDNIMSFSIVKGLYPHGRYAGYTFVFKSDGQLIQAVSTIEGRFWIRWMLTSYMPPWMRLLLNFVIGFMTGIDFREWGMPVQKIEKEWESIKEARKRGVQAPGQLQIKTISTLRPELAQYLGECQRDPEKDPVLVTAEMDLFKFPKTTPAKSKHLVIVEGLLPRNNEYFGAEKIKDTLGELGRTLVDGGILVNATRGSRFQPKKLYMDVYRREGDSLKLIREAGYDVWDNNESWHQDEAWKSENWLTVPVAKEMQERIPAAPALSHQNGTQPGTHPDRSAGSA